MVRWLSCILLLVIKASTAVCCEQLEPGSRSGSSLSLRQLNSGQRQNNEQQGGAGPPPVAGGGAAPVSKVTRSASATNPTKPSTRRFSCNSVGDSVHAHVHNTLIKPCSKRVFT